MEIKYSKTQFEGYTHRFIVEFKTKQPYHTTLQIYSNSDSYQNLDDFLNERKSEKIVSFNIVHRASKEQDDSASEFINEILKDI